MTYDDKSKSGVYLFRSRYFDDLEKVQPEENPDGRRQSVLSSAKMATTENELEKIVDQNDEKVEVTQQVIVKLDRSKS